MPELQTSQLYDSCKNHIKLYWILIIIIVCILFIILFLYIIGYRIITSKQNKEVLKHEILDKLNKTIHEQGIPANANYKMPNLDNLSIEDLQLVIHFKDDTDKFMSLLILYGFDVST